MEKRPAKTNAMRRLDRTGVAYEVLTGYIRGGCSPIGMKKPYPTFLDESALLLDRVAVGAGVRGLQLLLPPGELARITVAATGAYCE